jgi:hypothetical protein
MLSQEEGRKKAGSFSVLRLPESGTVREFGLNTYGDVEAAPPAYPGGGSRTGR